MPKVPCSILEPNVCMQTSCLRSWMPTSRWIAGLPSVGNGMPESNLICRKVSSRLDIEPHLTTCWLGGCCWCNHPILVPLFSVGRRVVVVCRLVYVVQRSGWHILKTAKSLWCHICALVLIRLLDLLLGWLVPVGFVCILGVRLLEWVLL